MRVLNHVLRETVCRQRPGLQLPVKGQGQNSLITWEILLPGLSTEWHVLLFAYSEKTYYRPREEREKRAKRRTRAQNHSHRAAVCGRRRGLARVTPRQGDTAPPRAQVSPHPDIGAR